MTQTSMSIKTFKKVAVALPPWVSILLRAGHGIGKSRVIRQVVSLLRKKHLDTKVIDMSKYNDLQEFFQVTDRRLSQMSEGDMVGLPSTDGECTRFNPPDWYKAACREPKALFLDELNRATPEVMQAAFQIVLDRELNGWKLHPESRVYSAINIGSSYTVNEIDPALLDRFFVIDLAPSVEEWCEWARDPDPVQGGNLDCVFPDFIISSKRSRGGDWLFPPKDAEPGERTPSPRSWEMTHGALVYADVLQKPEEPLFYQICVGFLGVECSIAFRDYAKSVDNRLTGEEIVNHYTQDPKVKKKVMRRKQGQQNEVVEKVADYVTGGAITELTERQGKNIAQLIKDLPDELKISLWSKLTSKGIDKIKLATTIHKYCAATVLSVFGVPMGTAGVGVIPNVVGIFKTAPTAAKP